MNNQMLTVRLKLSYVQVKKGWGGGVGEDMGRLDNKNMDGCVGGQEIIKE